MSKYQPKISEKNSIRISKIPDHVFDTSPVWLDLNQIEEVDTLFSSSHKIIYIVSNDSTGSSLHPIRDEKKRFRVIVASVK